MRRYIKFVLPLLIITLLVLTISISKAFNNRVTDKLTVAVARQPVFAIVYIAEALGYFEEADLEVELVEHELGRDALRQMTAGRVDAATVYDIPFVREVYNGQKVMALTTLHTSNKNSAIFSQKSRGVASPADLQGKRVGAPSFTSADFVLFSVLTDNGLRAPDVVHINTEPENLVKSYLDGQVDAVSVWHPYLQQLKDSTDPSDQSIFYADTYHEVSVLAAPENRLREKRTAYVKLLRSLLRAEQFINADPGRSIKIAAAALGNVNEKELAKFWPDFRLQMQLDNILLVTFEREANWFHDNDVYDGNLPNFRKHVFTDFLKEVRPERVTIF